MTSCTSTGDSIPSPSPPAPVPVSPEHPSPAPDGPGSAAAALEALCPKTRLPTPSGVPPEGTVPAPVAAVERAVEQMRGLKFIHPVIPDPVTHGQLVRGLLKSFDTSYPKALYDRRSLAWQTIGVVPPGTSIRHALESFGSSAVIGYYDTLTGKLVFIGTKDPSPYERDTLAHELTHAIDDQHFGLERLDRLGATCQDEASAASIAVVEGSATYVQVQYVRRFLTPDEQLQFVQEANSPGGSAGDVPPFILQTQEWSYTQGLRFVTALVTGGGEEAVDHALTDLPVSTEQIIHPERYPNDVPTPSMSPTSHRSSAAGGRTSTSRASARSGCRSRSPCGCRARTLRPRPRDGTAASAGPGPTGRTWRWCSPPYGTPKRMLPDSRTR